MVNALDSIHQTVQTFKPLAEGTPYAGLAAAADTTLGTMKNVRDAATDFGGTAKRVTRDYLTQAVTGFNYSNPFSLAGT